MLCSPLHPLAWIPFDVRIYSDRNSVNLGLPVVCDRVNRYRDQSIRHRASAIREIREGNWERVEELLWGSLVEAVKSVALSRGVQVKDYAEIQGYLALLARESRDRRLADSFDQLSAFASLHYSVQDSRIGPERIFQLVQRISYSVEKLWAMLPPDEPERGLPAERKLP